MDGRCAALLRAMREDASPQVRAEAALSLALVDGSVAPDTIRSQLLETATSDKELPARAAVIALGSHLDDSVSSELVALLRTTPGLWREIARSLAGHRSSEIRAHLEDVLEHGEDPRSRRGAARSLGLEHVNEGAGVRDTALESKNPDDSSFDDHPIFGYEDAVGNLHPCG